MQTTPMSELEAVNLMPSVIGEAPVNSLEDSGVADANLAHQILSYVARECQLIGWNWNTEDDYPIKLNQDKELVLPGNTLKVDTFGVDQGLDLVQRGKRLYDRTNHTYKFTKNVNVRITLFLGFDEIPETARNYITIRAARQFQERVLGPQPGSYTPQDEFNAMVALRHEETEAGDYNVLTGSWSVASILKR